MNDSIEIMHTYSCMLLVSEISEEASSEIQSEITIEAATENENP